jgi:hypothetical protein
VMEREVVIMGIQIAFPSGVRVLSRTGEVLQQFTADEPVVIKHGVLVRRVMTVAEWVARTLASAPQFSQGQINHARLVKRELVRLAEARNMPMSA